MKSFSGILIAGISLCLSGCQKVIKVDLDTASPRLVIDASIDWIKNTSGREQKIRLSTSTGYYTAAFPTVSGATVFIKNTGDTVFHFPESSVAGEYVCTDFVPVSGATYSLTIILGGETYTATETLLATPDIDSNIRQNNKGGMTGDEMEIEYSCQADGSREDYYCIGITTAYVAFPEYKLESDEQFQGNRLVRFYSSKDLKAGDKVNIRVAGVSKRFFEYFNKILLASGAENSPFPTTPSAARGNIINQSNDQHYAWAISDCRSLRYGIIPSNDFPGTGGDQKVIQN